MRATTCWTPKVSRATRALMMLELSPLLTAAKAPAGSIPVEGVGVVAPAHRGEGAGGVDPGVEEDLPVEARAGHLPAGELRAQPAERLRVLVDDRDAVAAALQPAGDLRADTAAAHDDHVHESLPTSARGRRRPDPGREATPAPPPPSAPPRGRGAGPRGAGRRGGPPPHAAP